MFSQYFVIPEAILQNFFWSWSRVITNSYEFLIVSRITTGFRGKTQCPHGVTVKSCARLTEQSAE